MSEISKDNIMSALATSFYDDVDFIEQVNDFTYARKVQLRKHKLNKQNYEQKTSI